MEQATPFRPPSRRLLLIGLVSIVLHVLALGWAGKAIAWLNPSQADAPVVQAMLIQPPPAEAIKTRVARPAPAPRPRPAGRPADTPAEAGTPIVPTSLPTTDSAGLRDAIEDMVPAAADTATQQLAAATEAAKPAETAGGQRFAVAPPPSAELAYDVRASYRGAPTYGAAKISWQFDGNSYAINGEVGVKILFAEVTLQTFGSKGDLDAFGIAPLLYREKGRRSSEVNTHFRRNDNLISFSASERTYQRRGGEQDRASVIWQLAAIGRGSADKIAANAALPIFVAGTRDGEIWNIQVVGEEEIDAGVGRLRTWHLVRIPQPGTYDRKLDIWLAPHQEWYPVRIRFTETNGDYIDMTVSAIDKPAPR